MKNNNLNEKLICEEYKNSQIGIESLALKYHVGKLKIKKILTDNGIEFKKRGAQSSNEVFVVPDWKVEKYKPIDGCHYVAVDRATGFTTKDVNNNGGVLTTYIHNTYQVEIPTLYDRRMYYMRTGNYWWEQWFDIKSVKDAETKKCPFCDWETVDLENKSGIFVTHLDKEHHMTIEEYLKKYPEDEDYFSKYKQIKAREEKIQVEGNYVVCPLCGKRYEKLTEAHMNAYHHMTLARFRSLYPYIPVMSDAMHEQTIDAVKISNLQVSKKRFVSRYEREIGEWLKEWGVEYLPNRQILIGREIDILIPSKKIGIEFDGLKFHTEFFGKKEHDYHLQKTIQCNENGYGLIHIFEDEFVNRHDIVKEKVKHILGVDSGLEKVPARKCEVLTIYKSVAKDFLEKTHIQGFYNSTVYYGCFYKDELIAVMSFKKGSLKYKDWELTRFATLPGYIYQGVGGKLFAKFIKEYAPDYVLSFADRRWTVDIHNNLYTKLGFEIENIGRPDYKYYNERIEKYQRVHKMRLCKAVLNKKYGFPMSMTELEMTRKLGYDRIWDCGLIKYVWRKQNM